MSILIIALILIGTAAGIDFVIRLRMSKAGQRKAFILGGAFDYSEYLKLRTQNGWSAWPVYVFFALILIGGALLCIGFLRMYAL